MDDLTYMLKICIQAVNVLIACEIGLFLLANRKGQSKGLKKSPFHPKITQNTYWGFFCFFLFSAMGFVFNGLETRWGYFFPGASVLIDGPFRILDNLKEISFLYAISSIFLAIVPMLIRIRVQMPLIIGLAAFPLLLASPPVVFYILACVVVPFGIFLFSFLLALVQLTQGKPQKQFLCILIGFLLYCASYLMMTHILDAIFKFGDYFIPETVMLAGVICMGAGIITVPSLNEAFSLAVIEQVFLATKEGKIILRHSFRAFGEKKITEMGATTGDIDDATFTASIVGIEGLLREISATKGRVKALDEGNKIFLIDRISSGGEQASNVFAILVTYLDLHVLRSQLLNLVYDVETHFLGDILANEKLPDASRAKIVETIENRFKVPTRAEKPTLSSRLLDAATPRSVKK